MYLKVKKLPSKLLVQEPTIQSSFNQPREDSCALNLVTLSSEKSQIWAKGLIAINKDQALQAIESQTL
jgi:hypothetical protein